MDFAPPRHGGVAEMRSGALSTHVPRGPREGAYPLPAHGGYNLTIAAIRYPSNSLPVITPCPQHLDTAVVCAF